MRTRLAAAFASLVCLVTGACVAEPVAAVVPAALDLEPSSRPRRVDRETTRVTHIVTPSETLDEIATRYDIESWRICELNALDCARPWLRPGDALTIVAEDPPMPLQRVRVPVGARSSWSALSREFGTPIDRLLRVNGAIRSSGAAPRSPSEVGDFVELWVEPRVLRRRGRSRLPPRFEFHHGGVSVGAPNDGGLEDGIRLPASDLFALRYPNIMYGSAYTLEQLHAAVARFRRRYDYRGPLMVADISRRRGGRFSPHVSHQSGRDIDIWLPTLAGSFERPGGERPRRPDPEEVDWYATWGLVESLISTEAVSVIFLSYEYQDQVYLAAKRMGATDEQLRGLIQWGPDAPAAGEGRRPNRGVLRHSAGHNRHIHVRFHCSARDVDCRHAARHVGDEDGSAATDG